MPEAGRLLFFAGLGIAVIGLVLWKLLPGGLPGDIVIKRENFTFAFPVVTCIVISVVLSFVLWLLRK